MTPDDYLGYVLIGLGIGALIAIVIWGAAKHAETETPKEPAPPPIENKTEELLKEQIELNKRANRTMKCIAVMLAIPFIMWTIINLIRSL